MNALTRLPSLRHLRYFVSLADELHFGRAAERCNVTQSTLSKGLQELEGALGASLAERTKRRVILTPLGREIAERGRRLLREAEALVDAARASAATLAGELRLGVIPTVGPYLLPRALPLLRRSFPDLRLYLREDLTESLLQGLDDGRLDAAIVALPFPIGDLGRADLFDDGYVLACARGHPLANLPQATGEDLAGRPMMLLERGHCLQRHALSAFGGSEISEDRSFAATSLPTLVAMVEEGLGITLLPELAVEAGIAEGLEIAIVPAPAAAPRKVALVWRRSSSRERDFRLLADALAQARISDRAGIWGPGPRRDAGLPP
jgi:LysR family hydrogen peroxide-inducible transcriptional activator